MAKQIQGPPRASEAIVTQQGNTSRSWQLWFTAVSKAFASKMDAVTTATLHHLAWFNSSGELEDSGKAVPTGDIVGTSDNQTLSTKTLTSPTIGDFTNANHSHANAAGGGTVAHSVLTGLTTGDPHTQYLLADGTRKCSGDFEINDIGEGLIVKSPDGSRWRLTVSDAGVSVWTKL
jgi:hypothetical protein